MAITKSSTRRAFVGSSAAAFMTLAAGSMAAGASQAMADAEEAQPTMPAEVIETEVLVVGAGPVGQSAALSAAEAGAKVLLIERSGCCTGKHHIVSACNTKIQEEAGADVTVEDYVATIMEGKKWSSDLDEDMVRFMCEQMAPTLEWMEDHGVEFSRCCAINGEPFMGLRGVATSAGRNTLEAFTVPMENACIAAGVEFMFDTDATALLLDDSGTVIGVEALSKDGTAREIHAKSVVLGTGGFGGDDELMRHYATWMPNFGPDLPEERWTLGDGFAIRQGMRIGAEICSRSGGFVAYQNTDNANVDLAGQGLHVGTDGKRYCDESLMRCVRTRHAIDAGNGKAYIIYDEDLVESLYTGTSSSGTSIASGEITEARETLNRAIEAGSAFKADTIEELAALIGINSATLVETVEKYNAACQAGVDEEFGKPQTKVGVVDDPEHVNDFTVNQIQQEFKLLNEVKTAPFYATRVTYGSYHIMITFGGLKTDKRAQVLSTDGAPIANLYAAGEAANGQIIGAVYPHSGIASAGAYIFGKIAGESAAANAM